MSATRYSYTQSVASTTWTINHQLGVMPAVEAFVMVDNLAAKAHPLSVVHTDSNTVVISWTVARTGYATLYA